jgi:hypothetical protein
MTQQEVEKRFKEWKPRVLILGTVNMKNGSWGLQSIICETKQEVYKAIRNFESFDVFFLKKSKEGQDYFRSESLKYENIIKTLRDENMGT